MKEGWKKVKLGEIATFSRGLTYSKHDETDVSDNVVLRSNNVNLEDGKLNLTELKYLKEDFIIPEDKKVKVGSLLICMSNGSKIHLGKNALIKEDVGYAFGGFMGQITPMGVVEGSYMHYAMSSPFYKDFICSLSAGANINNIKFKDLKEFEIPLPPLSDQERIVSYLDSAFAKIDQLKSNAEKQMEEAKALFASALQSEMEPKEGWEVRALGEVCSFFSGFAFKSNKFTKTGEAIIRISDIKDGAVDDSGCVFFDPKDYKENLSKYMIYPNDILIAMSGGTTGKIGVNKTNKRFYLNQRVGAFRENVSILNHRFLLYYLMTKSEESLKIAAGAAQPNLSTAQIRAFMIPLPSLLEQENIASRLDALSTEVRQLEENYKTICAECDAMKQAILRETFE